MNQIQELEAKFDEAFPYLFQKDLYQVLHKSYGEANTVRNLFGLQEPMCNWNLPFIRRAIIQSQLIELARRWGLKADWCYTAISPDQSIGANPYVEVKSGQFVLTESKIDEAMGLPRDAVHRTNNSLMNYSLFPEHQTTTDSIYVIATHVAKFGESRPFHVGFTFPDCDYSRCFHWIDLDSRFFSQGGGDGKSETRVVDPQPTLRDPNADKKPKDGSA